jgi:hypothetical protein
MTAFMYTNRDILTSDSLKAYEEMAVESTLGSDDLSSEELL